jgi:hypothetical protein
MESNQMGFLFTGSRNQYKANKKEIKIGHGVCCLAVKEMKEEQDNSVEIVLLAFQVLYFLV